MAGAPSICRSARPPASRSQLDFQSQDPDLPVVRECPTNERFMRLAWSRATGDHGLGLIAGSLVDGSICVWNPAALVKEYWQLNAQDRYDPEDLDDLYRDDRGFAEVMADRRAAETVLDARQGVFVNRKLTRIL